MSTPHTPGPWVVDTTNAIGAYGVWSGYPVNPGADGAGYPEEICSFRALHPLGKETKNANARLIAAAPDLLAALDTLTKHLMIAGSDMDASWAVHQLNVGYIRAARAAISKAKGEA